VGKKQGGPSRTLCEKEIDERAGGGVALGANGPSGMDGGGMVSRFGKGFRRLRERRTSAMRVCRKSTEGKRKRNGKNHGEETPGRGGIKAIAIRCLNGGDAQLPNLARKKWASKEVPTKAESPKPRMDNQLKEVPKGRENRSDGAPNS